MPKEPGFPPASGREPAGRQGGKGGWLVNHLPGRDQTDSPVQEAQHRLSISYGSSRAETPAGPRIQASRAGVALRAHRPSLPLTQGGGPTTRGPEGVP